MNKWIDFVKSEIYQTWSDWFEPVPDEVVNKTCCDDPKCKGNCKYRGFVKETSTGLRFKAFSVCQKCFSVVEF